MKRIVAIALGAAVVGATALGGLLVIAGGRDVRTEAPAPSAFRAQAEYKVEMTVLDRKVATGWEDWGWGPHEASGAGIRVNFAGYGGLILRHSPISAHFGALVFQFRAPPTFGDFLEVGLQNAQLGEDALPSIRLEARHIAQLADGQSEVLIPWRELNPDNQAFDRIRIRAYRMVGSDWVTVDHVVFTEPSRTDPANAPARPAPLSVLCDKPEQPINPLIYGIAAGVISTGETTHRVGGNTMSRFNWDVRAWNTGSDFFFENQKSDAGIDDWVRENLEHGLQMAVVVPTIGWVAKDGTSVGFPVSKFGPQRAHDPNRKEAGDGFRPDGKPLPPGPPTQTSVEAPPELIKRWVSELRKKEEERGKRGVNVYMLDNEPYLWNVTHRDVHPEPVTYDELLDRTIRYGTAIREADPEGLIAGPAEWGWSGMFYSAKDMESGWLLQPDRRAHGGVPLLPWYLQRLAAEERRSKKRILDWVDVHFYPQAPGIYGKDARTDPDATALRLRSTRALWDPSYKDESWIGERIQLIPRLRQWIADNYPGRGIALGEWSFGAETHFSGALAIAEALGRFGQQGLTAAYYWRRIEENTAAFQAFRAFRNFDGKGGRFLDFSLPTQEAPRVSLFASRDASRSRLVLVVLNLDAEYAADATIDVSGCGTVSARRVFAYGQSTPKLSELSARPQARPEAPGKVSEVVPPYSLAVIELTLANSGKP